MKVNFRIGTFLVLLSFSLSAQKDSTNTNKFDDYQTQLEKQFKKESWWYRTWNRYEVNPGFSKYAFGPSLIYPTQHWNDVKDNFGFRYHMTHLELSANFWRGKQEGDVKYKDAHRVAVGYYTPITNWSVGKRYMDVKGLLLQVSGAGGYANTHSNHAVYVAPALELQLPFVIVSARANLEYTFGEGFNVFPEIGIQLDALHTLLNPQLVKTGTLNTSHTSSTPIGGGWSLVQTSYSRQNQYFNDVGPFWGITPRVGWAHPAWTNNPFNTVGVGVTGRINFLGADIHYDKGKLVTGVVENANDLHATVKSKFDNSKVRGTVSTSEISFEGVANIPGLFLNVAKRNSVSKMPFTTTPLNRVNFHMGVTRIKVGDVQFDNKDSATAYTNQFFASNPSIERNAINDPTQFEDEWGVNYGISYEMGAIGIKVNNKLSKSNGRSTTLEFYYIIPITKVVKAYKKS